MRWHRWLWWWSAPSGFALPGPRIASAEYRIRLLAHCDNAIARGAVDLANGTMFDQLVEADLHTDLCELHEELSRRTTAVTQRKALHERRFERACARREILQASFDSETENLRLLDDELRARRARPRPAPSANGHRKTAATERFAMDEHR